MGKDTEVPDGFQSREDWTKYVRSVMKASLDEDADADEQLVAGIFITEFAIEAFRASIASRNGIPIDLIQAQNPRIRWDTDKVDPITVYRYDNIAFPPILPAMVHGKSYGFYDIGIIGRNDGVTAFRITVDYVLIPAGDERCGPH